MWVVLLKSMSLCISLCALIDLIMLTSWGLMKIGFHASLVLKIVTSICFSHYNLLCGINCMLSADNPSHLTNLKTLVLSDLGLFDVN